MMSVFKRLIFVFFVGVFFTSNIVFAQDERIKYSLGPRCNGNEVLCDTDEEPVCLELSPVVYISTKRNLENYYPSCENSYSPKCLTHDGKAAPETVVLSCIEFVRCETDESATQIAKCNNGKEATCLGNNNELTGCNCSDGTPAICEYQWQISDVNSLY